MKNPFGVWAICDKETNQMIGSIKFEKLDEIKGEAELGYFYAKIFGEGPDDRSGQRVGLSII